MMNEEKKYKINEIFYSLQGEGIRAGEPSFFVRFSNCNMQCDLEPGKLSPGGFRCDTEFKSGRKMSIEEIREFLLDLNRQCEWIVLTGGEPGLQVDEYLISSLHTFGYKLAIETNGTIALPEGLDHITVSPKCAEHALKQLTATEVKYVRRYGQGIPVPSCNAKYKMISPGFDDHKLDEKNLEWCIQLCKENPEWRLSVQLHNIWGVR